MIAITIFLLAAAPSLAALHPARHARRPVAVHTRHGRRPISLSARKPRECQAGAICVDGGDAQTRYRLPLAPDPVLDSKTRAMGDTGMRCGLIGQTICPTRTRMILKAGEDPAETIGRSFAPK